MRRQFALSIIASMFGIALAGCNDFQIDLTLTSGPYADVYDDGTTLTITGCSEGAILGCVRPPAGLKMTATVDAQQIDVPIDGAPVTADQLELGAFHDGSFRVAVPSPTDRTIKLAFPDAKNTVTLPDAFAITSTVPTQLSRAAGPLMITHELLPYADVFAIVYTTCGTTQSTDEVTEAAPGTLVVDLSADQETGTCTHSIHITETLPLGGDAALPVEASQIVTVSLTSTP